MQTEVGVQTNAQLDVYYYFARLQVALFTSGLNPDVLEEVSMKLRELEDKTSSAFVGAQCGKT